MRKKLKTIFILIILFLFVLNFFIFLSININFKKKIINLKKENNVDLEYVFKPVFIFPEIEIKSKNNLFLISFYFISNDEKEKIIEYSLIFYDEDYPAIITDILYDFYRTFKYKRIYDIESFQIKYVLTDNDKLTKWISEMVIFNKTYSDQQKFFDKKIKHFSKEISGNEFNKINDRIVIYINTWNHLFSNKDNNPLLSKIVYQDYEIINISRNQLDNFRNIKKNNKK